MTAKVCFVFIEWLLTHTYGIGFIDGLCMRFSSVSEYSTTHCLCERLIDKSWFV